MNFDFSKFALTKYVTTKFVISKQEKYTVRDCEALICEAGYCKIHIYKAHNCNVRNSKVHDYELVSNPYVPEFFPQKTTCELINCYASRLAISKPYYQENKPTSGKQTKGLD